MSIRPWAIWRRIQYGIIFGLILFVIGTLIYFSKIYVPPNCFDGILNGGESGIDCGGDCVRICAAEIMSPQVTWAEAFQISDNRFNVVAYIENRNLVAGTAALDYQFLLYDGQNLVAEKSGVTELPPDSVYPVFESIAVDNATDISRVELNLGEKVIWVPANVDHNQFRSADIKLSNVDAKPRLDVEIENTSLIPASEVEVVATIFSENGNPVTASRTFIEDIASRSTENIVFTWPNPISKTVKSCSIPTDVLLAIDLSGSMNNDGGNPPQPVTAALKAASEFVGSLNNEADQVGVVTFASTADLVSQLNNSKQAVSELIQDLAIENSEEQGFTNTAAAISLAETELSSVRHSDEARKVLILLTDGLPTAEGEDEIIDRTIQQAKVLNDSGVEIYSIGLGENVDENFIREIATDISNTYLAPTGEDLQNIYSQITTALCEVGPTKIEVVVKTKADFAPLE